MIYRMSCNMSVLLKILLYLILIIASIVYMDIIVLQRLFFFAAEKQCRQVAVLAVSVRVPATLKNRRKYMAKRKSIYVCSECGHSAKNWMGKCPSCNNWDTMIEELEQSEVTTGSRASRSLKKKGSVRIAQVEAEQGARFSTGVGELDCILGGGLVRGAAVLIGGEPGVGKSTLLMQAANWLSDVAGVVLYVTAEESLMQLKLRAERLSALSDNLHVLAENNIEEIQKVIEDEMPAVVILDSIQMVFWDIIGSAPGSVGQVRECAATLVAQAKRLDIPLFLVGHVTKEGSIAGPKVLEHMVDVVLQFEGDRFHAARILRAVKNRFGAVNEIGVFEMSNRGLSPVEDASRLFLSGREDTGSGSVVTAALEGSRPFLVEVQALVTEGYPGNAKRQVSGADRNRAQMILAVLEKRAEVTLYDKDVFLNVVGGANLGDTGGDLSVALAIVSSLLEIKVDKRLIAIGELGLGGEVRNVAQMEARLKEAERLGFHSAIVPKLARGVKSKLRLYEVADIDRALEALRY